MYDLEREAGIVYYVDSEDTKETSYEAFSIRARNEKEMLEDFWEGAQSYDTFVTFGGREFDVPFLNIRSAVHGIRPSCPLMEDRYLTHQKNMYHVDLRDEFSYYGAVRRKASLHLFCRAFGIVSPIREEGVGESVDELFHAKRFQKIAERNARTVIATTKLYKKWLMYLAPYDFINRMG